jgi:Domain of unknown function (DUF4265)
MDNKNQLVELFCEDGEADLPYLGGESIGHDQFMIKDIYWDLGFPGNPLDLSLDDIVEAQPNEDGHLAVTKIIKKSGYITLRMMATARSACVASGDFRGEDAAKFWDYLEKIGCTSMVSMASFWLIHIPPSVDVQAVLDYIQAEAIPLQLYQ